MGVFLRRPTTFRTLNRHLPATVHSVRRVGEAPFDSAARTHLVRTRTAGGLLDWRDVQRGRNTSYPGRTGENVTPIPPNRVIIRPLPGKERRRFTPVLDTYGFLRPIP